MTVPFVTANLWKDNPQIGTDLATLLRDGATFIGMQEAAGFGHAIRVAAAAHGYTAYGTTGDTRPSRQNPVLVRDDAGFTLHGWHNHRLNRAVGSAPERTATVVRGEIDGEKIAVVNAHKNAGVQGGPAKPKRLPRVREFVTGFRKVLKLVTNLRALGYRVVVLGDFNWAFHTSARQWVWAPRAAFQRVSMVTQYDKATLPRPKDRRRAIDYVAWVDSEWTYDGQSYVTPEKSDHPFHRVDLTLTTQGDPS